MSIEKQDFFESLRATFRIEAAEHLQAIAAGLLELEKAPPLEERRRLVEKAFRDAHSLKGAARAVNFTEIESVCQTIETIFASLKRQQTAPVPQELDRLHALLDSVSAHLDSTAPTRPANGTAPALAAVAPPPQPVRTDAAPVATDKAPAAETVRISVAKLDAQLLEAEEMLVAKLAAGQRASDLRELFSQVEHWNKEWESIRPEMRMLRRLAEAPDSISPDAARAPGLVRLLEFADRQHNYARSIENKLAALRQTAEQDRVTVGKIVDDLLADSKKMLMLPLSTLGALFPKIVRDLCRDQGKEAGLVIRGDEFEVDKRILEEMKDPFIHILRNCVDHGIETPAERARLGKPPRATISLTVSPIGCDKIELVVSDDGAGVDVEKVKESAVRRGLISPEQARTMSDADALALIFQADVSTSPLITQLSGRGLGLAIVREKTEKLGGRVTVASRRNAGTTLRITLPVAVATFRGILVEAAGRQFIVPTVEVERVTRFKAADVQTVEGRESLSLGGRAVALARLAETLELSSERPEASSSASVPAVILGSSERRMAFAVDEVRGEQEVLVKRFGRPLSRVPNIAGATILGSGQVAPILNVADLLKSAKKRGRARAAAPEAASPEKTAADVLVVEDSITSRMLLKGILESAGYKVRTAVDGVEAFASLRSEHFDLVVSDVEMPRMNGFDLTARIRQDKKLAELPVVLVTALETREDRERGIDAGANAYLVKNNFDQNNLLEAVRRLV